MLPCMFGFGLLAACILALAFPAEARPTRYQTMSNVKYFNDVCLEIGRTAVYPKFCKPTGVMYKGVYCFGCPEAHICRPACTGGKVCINQRCVCPPKQLLIDCNGRCQSPTVPCRL